MMELVKCFPHQHILYIPRFVMADSKKLDEAIKRSKAVCSVSTQILKVASVQISAIKMAEDFRLANKDMPALIATKDSGTETENRQKLLGVAK